MQSEFVMWDKVFEVHNDAKSMWSESNAKQIELDASCQAWMSPSDGHSWGEELEDET